MFIYVCIHYHLDDVLVMVDAHSHNTIYIHIYTHTDLDDVFVVVTVLEALVQQPQLGAQGHRGRATAC